METWPVQIRRPGPALTIDFDDDDGDRRAITPINLRERAEELQPR